MGFIVPSPLHIYVFYGALSFLYNLALYLGCFFNLSFTLYLICSLLKFFSCTIGPSLNSSSYISLITSHYRTSPCLCMGSYENLSTFPLHRTSSGYLSYFPTMVSSRIHSYTSSSLSSIFISYLIGSSSYLIIYYAANDPSLDLSSYPYLGNSSWFFSLFPYMGSFTSILVDSFNPSSYLLKDFLSSPFSLFNILSSCLHLQFSFPISSIL